METETKPRKGSTAMGDQEARVPRLAPIPGALGGGWGGWLSARERLAETRAWAEGKGRQPGRRWSGHSGRCRLARLPGWDTLGP